MKQGYVYKFECKICKSAGKTSVYFGENARTPYDRGGDHGRAMRNMSADSPLVEHHLEHHRGQEIDFSMKVLHFIPSPLWRQAREAWLITNAEVDLLLNRKGDGCRICPPL